jgi:HD-GYP domain-containing protein (c-di-GMP phosphodiesterase class II)
MIAPITYLRPALDIPLYHHEKWDGTSYPRGLKGEVIPLVDVWDALTSDRPYRPAWSNDAACAILVKMLVSFSILPYIMPLNS